MKNNKKIKAEKYRSEEQEEIIRFIKILIIVIIFVLAAYLFTRIFVTKDLFNKDDNTSEEVIAGTINYDVTILGSLLNKPEDEYYVLAYDSENLRAVYYSSLITNYKYNEDALKIYYANLNNPFNAKYYDKDNTNLDVKSLEDLRVGDLTLFKIKNGKISEILTDEKKIAEELAYKDTAN